MASPDVLATALVDLEEGYSELFTEWSPTLEKIIMRGNKETLESYQKEFTVVTGGPGSVTNVVGGSEIITGGRNQTGQRGNEIAPRLIYAFDVPGKDIDEANGEQDLAKLIQKYPDLAMMDFHERIATQFVMGTGTDVGGFITLNGQTTYAPAGVNRTGILDPATAAASQTATVHGLAKNTVAGWYNQYEDITSFASNGRYRLRKAYWAASRQAHKIAGNVDLLMADETSYNNYVQDLDDPVRFVSSGQNQKGDPAKPNIKQGIAFLDSTMYLEEKILASGFTGAAADGVIYGLHSATWNMFIVGRGGVTGNKGFFSTRGPHRVPNQDMFRYEIILSMGMWCDNLRANFVVSGAATP